MEKKPLYVIQYKDWQSTVTKILDASGFKQLVEGQRTVLLKPNLVNADPPPITTPVQLIEAIIRYIQENVSDVKIIVGEGCGSMSYDTFTPFRELGYFDMVKKYDVELVDLNVAELVRLENPECDCWKEIYIPELVINSFLVSVPVLKAHSLAEVTLTMKNMMGVAPPEHYNAGSWKKSAFHARMQESVFDLNRYRTPDFTVLDATVGMSEAHLWGPACDPPPGLIVASCDPVAIDAYGTGILNRNWKHIDHIKNADNVLGYAEPSEIIEL